MALELHLRAASVPQPTELPLADSLSCASLAQDVQNMQSWNLVGGVSDPCSFVGFLLTFLKLTRRRCVTGVFSDKAFAYAR
jgi:hypothetical protein